MTAAVSFKNVYFSYKNQQLFQDLSIDIKSNQMISIIGLNGSGKSSFFKLALGLLVPQRGTIEVLSHPAGHLSSKKIIGCALQDIAFPEGLKVKEVLNFVKNQYLNPTITLEELTDDFDLKKIAHKTCQQLSGGMKRRLALACALIGKPKIIFLDEPSTGLDSHSRQKLLKKIREYQKQSQALVIMINHHPQEILEYVDQFYHFKNAQISVLSNQKMTELATYRKVSFYSSENLTSLPQVICHKKKDHFNQIIAKNSDQLTRYLIENNISYQGLEIEKLGSEELMLEIL